MSLHKVFVYGTLKTGEPNHHYLTNKKGHIKFLGKARTVEKYPLIIATKYNIPMLLFSPGNGNIIEGEIYEVDDDILKDLDELEEHPDYYIRNIYTVLLKNKEGTETSMDCWIYFIEMFNSDLLKQRTFASYSSSGDHNLPYLDRSRRDLVYLNEWKSQNVR